MERLDSLRPVETPEGVGLPLRPAGPVARFWALLLDQAILWGALIILMIPLALLGPAGQGLGMIAFFLGQWGYPVCFEVLAGGRTPGKRVMALKVVRVDGRPVDWGASLLRNLARVVDALPGIYTVGLMSTLLTRDFQRLGDLLAGTLVVHDQAAPRLGAPPAWEPAQPPPGLGVGDQAALVAFAERLPRLARDRAWELANLLRPLHRTAGEEALARVKGWAAHILGTGAGA